MSNQLLPFVSFDHAEELVRACLRSRLAVILRGSPSSGKTAIGNKLAKEIKLKPIVFSLMDHEPTDICGLPDLSGNKATFKPFDTFPVEGDEVPQGYAGFLIMLDEFSSGTRAMQSAANRLLYERKIGNKDLHPRAFVIAMGNLASDNAYVIEEPQHTKSRMAHLYVQQDIKEWVTWAFSAEIDPRVIAYAEMKPQTITRYDPESVDTNYPCARTMEMLSTVLKQGKLPVDRKMLPLIQGILGLGAGLEFFNFIQLKNELPTIDEILADPTGTKVPVEMQHRYCLSTLIAEHFNSESASKLVQYIQRMGMESKYFIFRAVLIRDPRLMALPEIREFGSEMQRYADGD